MELLGYKELVGNMATVVTIVNFLVGSQVCYEFVTKRSTGSASPMTFLVGVLMTFAWFSYGVLREDHSIQLVNGVGLGKGRPRKNEDTICSLAAACNSFRTLAH